MPQTFSRFAVSLVAAVVVIIGVIGASGGGFVGCVVLANGNAENVPGVGSGAVANNGVRNVNNVNTVRNANNANVAVVSRSDEVDSRSGETASTPFRPGLMRIDFGLTAAVPTRWDGEIRLSNGSFADLVPLGVEPTCATAFFFADAARTRIGLQTVAALPFCGFEATVFAPRDARLEIRLTDRETGRALEKTILVERLIDSSTQIPLAGTGLGFGSDPNAVAPDLAADAAVYIVRAPADELPVRVVKIDSTGRSGGSTRAASTVFQPGESFRLTVLPRSSASRLTGDLTLTATLTPRGAKEPVWRESQEIPFAEIQRNDAVVGDPTAAPLAREFVVAAPNVEGAFDVELLLTSKAPATAASRATFAPAFLASGASSSDSRAPLARRVVQGVVVSSAPLPVAAAEDGRDAADPRAELLETIDPTNPGWRKTFSKRSVLPSFRKSTGGASDGEKREPAFNPFRFGAVGPNGSQPSTDDASKRTFAETGEVDKPESDVEADGATVLGQSPVAPGFGKNIFGSTQSQNAERASLEREALAVARRWSFDRFQTLRSSFDRSAWGLTGGLWDRPLSSGNSEPFGGKSGGFVGGASGGFLRLDPNGTPPRRPETSAFGTSANKIAPVAWFDSTAKRVGETANPVERAKTSEIVGAPNESNANFVSWEAFPVPIREPGKPHLLEIEYPADFPQRLGISVLEPSPCGGLFPSSLDVGLVVSDDALGDRSNGGVARYSVLFWPKSKTPTILLANRSSKTAAAFGQIRIYRADADDRAALPASRGRTVGLALTKPALADQFSAVRKNSSFGVLGAEDWTTFDDATSRAARYLSAANFDSTLLTVVADGTALYPSSLLAPTPRCDGGVFLPTGGDPVRKDVLALALAKFDARRATLIPTLQLNVPIPTLEATLRAIHSAETPDEERAALEGVEWIGPDGRLLIESRQAADGTGPYYNVLHPETQKAVLAIVAELAARCAGSECFGGIGLDVGAGGWLALPDDVFFGLDDATIARFVRESNLQAALQKSGERRVQELLFAKGPERYRVRAEFIRDVCLDEWTAWRADALARFYRQVRETVAAARPDARLYLVATTALDGPNSRALLYPTLDRASKLRAALRNVGLDPKNFANDPAITLLRPEIVATTAPLAQTAETDEFATPDSISLFARGQAFPGALFYRRADKEPLPGFDAISPFRPTVVELETRAVPADWENRRRFARQLATADALCLFDGGDRPAFGEETVLRDWIDAFRALPAVPFADWSPLDAEGSEQTIQPLVVRYYRNEKETWAYFLNAAPFHLGVKASFKRRSNAPFETFAGRLREAPETAGTEIVWSFSAAPFDLVALRIADPKATIETVETSRPDEICGSDGRLTLATRDFVDRVLAARRGVGLDVRNGGFEESFAQPNASATSESTANANAPDDAKGANSLLGLEMPKMTLFKRPNAASGASGVGEVGGDGESAPTLAADKIPGWRVFGEGVDAELDETVVQEGRAALRLSAERAAGGIVGQPFEAPTTGRLCAQISFGVPVDATTLPLRVCLTGTQNGRPYRRRAVVGPTILERAKRQGPANPGDSVVWIRDVVLFDRLPLDGLDDLSLRFDLLGPGTVWFDDVRLYKLAFADSELKELMRLVDAAEFRVAKGRDLDALNLLDGYWARLLREQIPDDSPLLASLPARAESVAVAPSDESTPAGNGANGENARRRDGDADDKPTSAGSRVGRAFRKLKFW